MLYENGRYIVMMSKISGEVPEWRKRRDRMKKKLMGLCLAAVMALTAVGCSGTPEGAGTAPAGQTADNSQGAQGSGETQGDQGAVTGWKPSHDITIRVPNAAGGTMDTITRILGQGVQKATGATVLINNMTGASGAIAANDLLSRAAEPEEMMASGIGLFTLAPLFNKDIKVNLDDFTIISGMVTEDFILCVNPGKSGINSWEELKAYGQDNRILFGSNTPGGTTHMLGTALFGDAGLKAEAVTSDGTNKDMLALTSGDVVCAVGNASACQQFIEEGTAVPIAVFSPEPYKGFDGFEVPTVKSLGYDIEFRSCNFLMAKSGVDQGIVNQIYSMISDYTKTEGFLELAKAANYVPDIQDGASVRKMIEDSAATCQEIHDKYYKRS